MTLIKVNSSNYSNQDDDNWLDCIAKIRNDLESLVVTTEDGFLNLGDKLHDFSSRAKEVSETALSVIELIQSEIVNATEDFRDLLKRLNSFLQSNHKQLEQKVNALYRVSEISQKIELPTFDFVRCTKELRVLAFLIRLENAHLNSNNQDFSNLSDEVSRLVNFSKEKAYEIRRKLQKMDTMVRQSHTTLKEIRDVEFVRVNKILNNLQQCKSMLTDVNQRSTNSAEQISVESQKISENISEIVTVSQFHDITRQKVEHVNEAFDDLIHNGSSENLSDESAMSSQSIETHDLELNGEIGRVCALQALQLQKARKDILNAVSEILENLTNIMVNVDSLTVEIQRLVQSVDEESQTYLKSIENDITEIIQTLLNNIKTHQELKSSISPVSGILEEIGEYTEDIKEIESEMDIIAINGMSDVARLKGKDGAGLTVLVKQITSLSRKTSSLNKDIIEYLLEITGETDLLKSGLSLNDEVDDTENAIHEIIDGLDLVVQKMRPLNEGLMRKLEGIGSSTETLRDDIQLAIDSFTTHHEFDQVLGDSADVLKKIVNQSGEDVSEYIDENQLNDLMYRYTMNSEREVHSDFVYSYSIEDNNFEEASFVSKIETRKDEEESPDELLDGEELTDESEDYLGDNIELF